MMINPETTAVMNERFGHDNLIALATMDGDSPAVRTVNAYYEDGCFYTITYALSGKMKQIAANHRVAICGDWFTARGIAEDMGHILRPENADLAARLRTMFSSWYGNGHTNEADPNTIILRIRLTGGILYHHGTRFDIEF